MKQLQIGPMGSHKEAIQVPTTIQVPSIEDLRREGSLEHCTVADCFVREPESWTIVEKLTKARATVCEHGRNPCIMRCGVELVQVAHGCTGAWVWIPIPLWRRVKWLQYQKSKR